MKDIFLQHKQLVKPVQKVVRHQQQTKPLPVCDILFEINKLNDKSLAALLGKLDFDRINIQYYNVDILDVVSDDKGITFYSNAGFYGNDAIEIKMLIKQQIGDTEKTVINGNFIYTIRNSKQSKFYPDFLNQ